MKKSANCHVFFLLLSILPCISLYAGDDGKYASDDGKDDASNNQTPTGSVRFADLTKGLPSPGIRPTSHPTTPLRRAFSATYSSASTTPDVQDPNWPFSFKAFCKNGAISNIAALLTYKLWCLGGSSHEQATTAMHSVGACSAILLENLPYTSNERRVTFFTPKNPALNTPLGILDYTIVHGLGRVVCRGIRAAWDIVYPKQKPKLKKEKVTIQG